MDLSYKHTPNHMDSRCSRQSRNNVQDNMYPYSRNSSVYRKSNGDVYDEDQTFDRFDIEERGSQNLDSFHPENAYLSRHQEGNYIPVEYENAEYQTNLTHQDMYENFDGRKQNGGNRNQQSHFHSNYAFTNRGYNATDDTGLEWDSPGNHSRRPLDHRSNSGEKETPDHVYFNHRSQDIDSKNGNFDGENLVDNITEQNQEDYRCLPDDEDTYAEARLDVENWTEQQHYDREISNTANVDDMDFKKNEVQTRGDNSEFILDDGSKTYVFRKKVVPINGIQKHTISRKSSVKRKSVLTDGYVPSHRDNIVTLQDKVKMLRKQETVHGVVSVFREKILEDAESNLKGIAGWRYRQILKWNTFKEHVQNVVHVLEPWAGSFKTIEGRFGTAIMNYFRFIRWLMFMNLYMVVIMIGVTLIPQLILEDSPFIQSQNNSVEECTENYNSYIKNITSREGIGSQILDTLQGTGWMEQTVLFYGFYQNKTMLDDQTNYNMSLSYLLATGACFLISFFLIIRNTGKGLKQGIMNTDSTVNQYFNKVFCGGWDFCISDQKAANRKHKNILQELEADLETQRLIWKRQSRTITDKIKLFAVRTALNIFVIAVLGGSLYLIYYTNDQMLQDSTLQLHPIVQTLVQYLPSITITLLNVLVPILFNKLVLLEDYTPVFEIRITLLRIILLRLASLGILIGSLYGVITTSDGTVSTCGNSRWDIKDNTNGTDDKFRTSIKCWETYVGQQIYKLIILDFLVGVITTLVMEFPRRIIYQKFHATNKLVEMVGQEEFDLPKVVLDIVYSQTLCWMGLFFCPLTPLLAFLKCFIFFYVRKVSLLQNCVQPVRPYKTSRSNSLFGTILFLSFLLSTIPIAYMIGSFQPSQSCGPFREYSGDNFVFFNTITNVIETWPSTAVKAFRVIGSAVFLIPAIIVVCSVIYGYWASKESIKKQIELLQEELSQEGRDKQFLVTQVNDILQKLDGSDY